MIAKTGNSSIICHLDGTGSIFSLCHLVHFVEVSCDYLRVGSPQKNQIESRFLDKLTVLGAFYALLYIGRSFLKSNYAVNWCIKIEVATFVLKLGNVLGCIVYSL